MKREWTEEDETRAWEMASQGHSSAEVAKALGRNRGQVIDRVRKLAKARGVKRPWRRSPHNPWRI